MSTSISQYFFETELVKCKNRFTSYKKNFLDLFATSEMIFPYNIEAWVLLKGFSLFETAL